MYTIQARIRGVAPILQHAFGATTLAGLQQGTTKRTGTPDYSLEWMTTMYADPRGFLYQPATHLEGCLVKAAAGFKVKGARGKSFKDPVRAYCYVVPEHIPLLWNGDYIATPTADLLQNPTEALSVSVMRVVVQRSAVARSRLQVAAGWEMVFNMEIHDEQLQAESIKEILSEGGRAVGIGDFRPRYGRFEVVNFTEL